MRPFITNNPQRINKPMNYQSFRPGEWSLPKKSASIFVQNNFYGNSGYHGWGDAWASPEAQQHKHSFWDTLSEIIGVAGLGVGLAGNILGIFKKD